MKYFLFLHLLFLALTAFAKEEPESVKWKFYSKNKSHIYIDYKAKDFSQEDSFGMLYTQDFAEASWKNYSLGLRKTMIVFAKKNFDHNLKDHDYQYSNELFNHSWEHWLDRLYFKGKWKPVNFTVGDFYESMNRGMAFSMKNDPVHGDNSIRGGSVNISHKGFHMKTFGGRANPQIRDKATFQRMLETDDWLVGLEAGYKWKKLDFGVEYGYGNYGKYHLIKPEEEASIKTKIDSEKEFHLIGAYISLKNPFPGFTFYAGATYVPYAYENTLTSKTVFDKEQPLDVQAADMDNATAFYSSALYYFDFGKKKSRFTFKVEGKCYNKYFLNYTRMEELDYNRRYFNPPTLLPMDLQLDNEFDTWAIGAKVSLNDKHLTKAKYSINFVKGDSLDNKEALPASRSNLISEYKEEDFWYIGGKGEKSWQHFNLSANIGYHSSKGNKYPTLGVDDSRYWIVAGLHLGGYASKFSFKFNNDYYNKDMTVKSSHEYDSAHELKSVVDLSWDSKYFITFKNTYWNNKSAGDKTRSWHPGAAIGFKYNTVRFYVFGGLEKGGLTCDGGACRFLPDFKGIKAELDVSL